MFPLQTFGIGMVGLALILALVIIILGFLQALANDATSAPTPQGRRDFLGGIISLGVVAIIIGVLSSQAVDHLYSAQAELDADGILTINSGETHTVGSDTEEDYEGVDIHETGTLVIQSSGTLTIND